MGLAWCYQLGRWEGDDIHSFARSKVLRFISSTHSVYFQLDFILPMIVKL